MIMRRTLATTAVVGLAIAGLAACDGPHKGMHCVRSHDETYQQPVYGSMKAGKTYIPYVMYYIDEQQNVCDQWVPNLSTAAPHS